MSPIALVSIFAGPVLALAIVVAVMRSLGGSQKEIQRLLQVGIPAQARVLHLQHTGSSVSFGAHRHLRLQLGLEVHPQGGAPYPVESLQLVSELQIPALQPGAWLQVKIDPVNPQNLAIAGFGGGPHAGGFAGGYPVAPGMGYPGTPGGYPQVPMPGGMAPSPSWGAVQVGPVMNQAFSRAIRMTILISVITTVPLLAVFVDWSSIFGDGDAPKGGYCKALLRCCAAMHGGAGSCGEYENLPAAGCKTAYESYLRSAKAVGKTCE